MGLVYLPTCKPLKKSTFHVGKYTSPMDPMGNNPNYGTPVIMVS